MIWLDLKKLEKGLVSKWPSSRVYLAIPGF